MNGPILVRPVLPPIGPARWVPPEKAVEDLIEDLRAQGLDARISYDAEPSEGGVPWDLIVFWVAARAGEAVIHQVVQIALSWMRRRFRQYPEDPPRKRSIFAQIVLYEGDEGELFEIIELRSADEEPIRRSAEDFERFTRRKKPLEGVRRWRDR
jgi:hypothetical protein